MPFLTSRGLPIGAKGRLYSSSVHSVMLYGSEIGPVKKDAIRLKRNDPRMVKWMCKVRLEDRIFAEELRTRLKLKSMMESLHDRRLQWFGYLWKIRESVWSSKCTTFKVSGSSPEVDHGKHGMM